MPRPGKRKLPETLGGQPGPRYRSFLDLSSAAILGTGLALLVLAIGQAANPRPARAEDVSTEVKITAALVYNFCKFVSWPETADERLILGVAGDTGLLAGFGGLEGKAVGRQSLAVIATPDTASMAGIGLVYLPADKTPPIEEALARLRGLPVLTISDSEDFCDRGGMIQLNTVRGKVRFTINETAARQAGLGISSQLLKMAQQVIGGD